MSIERDAWIRLVMLGELPAHQQFSPTKAQEGGYTALLKEACAKPLPTGDDQPLTGGKVPTVGDAVQAMEAEASRLIASTETPHQHRLTHLRVKARELNLPLRDQDLRRLLADARRRGLGVAEGVGSRPLSFAPVPWLAEGLLMRGCLNLVVGPPKVGKTSFITGLVGAWAAGASSYLGLPLIGPCPPVLIVGPDQPEGDWARLLASCGLLDQHNRLKAPLVNLYTAGQPLQLDDEGIERIATDAAEHPGLLVLVDSLAAATRLLGVSENDAEIAAPLMALLEALDPHGATTALIHHAGKASISGSPSLASRGSSAVPAIASQTVSLSRLTDGQAGSAPDRRVVVKTEGRGGSPIEMLVERTDAGWISHGDAEAVMAERWRQQEEARLPGRQGQALEECRDRWETDHLPMDAQTLAARLELGGDGERKARTTLDALVRRGLLVAEIQTTSTSRRKVYRPSGGVRSPGGGVSSEASQPSEPSEPISGNGSLILQNPYGERDRRDRRDKRDRRTDPLPEPETLRSPSSGGFEQSAVPLDLKQPLPPVRLIDNDDDPHWSPRTA